ncbi:hypothetical protein [Lysobacter silvisoli]|uniref:Anti-sigma factor n=1 Tax=Lysobacter silvisoli TaxID=2293254 RepID=A0A371K0P9_9GAMM|nr:hypothetical protein [Lysobacter silvisoli]RDZ27417.1 hypothetical protein DX914_14400 [Lysobacter silvisoli]
MHISDDDLILYHYRDGLPPERLREIAAALAASPELAQRYTQLRRVLAAADAAALPPYDPNLEARLWQRLQPRLQAESARAGNVVPLPTRALPPRAKRWRHWDAGLAAAAVLGVAAYLPFALNRDAIQPQMPALTQAPQRAPEPASSERASRVLDAYVAGHLRSTEGVLLSVVNNQGGALAAVDPEYARELADDNRLYAEAAAQRGDRALAGFLRSLEPTLIELANRGPDAGIEQDKALRDYVEGNDLVFQLRAVETRLQQRQGARANERGLAT